MYIWQDRKTMLSNKKVRVNLSRYFNVMENNNSAKFLIAKKLSADFSKSDSLDKLWKLHDRLIEKFYTLQKELDARQQRLNNIPNSKKSFLDLKITIATKILENCRFCHQQCGCNRLKGELGYCKCGNEIAVSTIFPHTGEEPELIPSGTIFTLGCTLRCLHCQNWTISQWIEPGKIYSKKQLASEVKKLRKFGCKNISLVGGDPTSWVSHWLEIFKHVDINVPIIWNSNSYYSLETAKILTGFVDVYLLDFKYGSDNCSQRISNAPNYWKICTRNHLYAKKYGELIIRVLVLPGHLECCTKPILNWISNNLGNSVRVNLMFQYRPKWRANEISEIRRLLTKEEKNYVVQLANEVGLTNFIS
ncbi:MAG: radical SAM protein [Candidatus Bathyarchaeota archaeon]